MRMMNLPDIAPTPNLLEENVVLLRERLNGVMPSRSLSFFLIGYMAWPDDDEKRNWWMLAQLARLIATSGAKLSVEPPAAKTLEAFELFGGLCGLADAADVKLQEELARVQGRWTHVADVLQLVVDIKYAPVKVPGGASISKAMDLTQRHASLPTKTVFTNSWSAYRSVAPLIAAAAYLARESTKDRPGAGSALTAVLVAPEAVTRLAASYQQFALTHRSHGHTGPLVNPDILWQVPVPDSLLPLPARRLSHDDLAYLTTERRAPRKDGRPPQVDSE
jgi:hypothetical protein